MEATASPHWSLGHLPYYDPLPTYQLLGPAIPDTPTKSLCFLELVCAFLNWCVLSISLGVLQVHAILISINATL